MTYGPIPVRFVNPTGWVAVVSVWWGGVDACKPHLDHIARSEVARGEGGVPPNLAALGVDIEDWHPQVDAKCESCDALFDPAVEHWHSGGIHRVWPTPSGELEPGCLYWADWHHRDEQGTPVPCPKRLGGWTNCEGRHLNAVLPDGHHWDMDSRASNCELPDDGEHRCWVRHHNPDIETAIFTVDKNGLTCQAGGGSIDDGTYHGFLTSGAFTAG